MFEPARNQNQHNNDHKNKRIKNYNDFNHLNENNSKMEQKAWRFFGLVLPPVQEVYIYIYILMTIDLKFYYKSILT